MKLGAQLYTVNEYTENLKDFDKSLGKIAEIGYEYVQVSGTEYAMVEQDNCFGEDPFACLERSFKHLRALGL